MSLAMNTLRLLARKVQAPATRAAVSGQRSFATGDDLPADPKDLVRVLPYLRALKQPDLVVVTSQGRQKQQLCGNG